MAISSKGNVTALHRKEDLLSCLNKTINDHPRMAIIKPLTCIQWSLKLNITTMASLPVWPFPSTLKSWKEGSKAILRLYLRSYNAERTIFATLKLIYGKKRFQ